MTLTFAAPRATRRQWTPPPVWLTTLAFAALHLVLAARLWLVQDEAYYALWATHLQPAYYDHPPMIALWNRIGETLLGATPLGVRLVSVLGFALITPVTAAIARAVGGDKVTARWAALMFNCMAAPFALGFTATPDAPSTLLWALATLALVVAPEARGRLWLLAGLLLALGVLSKLTNLFLCVALALWLVATPDGRAQLRRPVVWGAAVLVLAILAPFLWWSASHDWLGLSRQFGRIGSAREHSGTLSFLAGAVLSVTPLLFWRVLVSGGGLNRKAQRLVWLGAPLVFYLLVHSLHHAVNQNWIAPLFPSLAVLAAIGSANSRIRPGLATGVAFGLSGLALALALWPGRPIFHGDNPPNQTKGWPALTGQISRLAEENGAHWIATLDYGTTGELAFALPATPVHAVTEPRRWNYRGDFPKALCGTTALLIQTVPQTEPPQTHFLKVGKTQILQRQSGGVTLRSYAATPVSGWRGGACAQAQP